LKLSIWSFSVREEKSVLKQPIVEPGLRVPHLIERIYQTNNPKRRKNGNKFQIKCPAANFLTTANGKIPNMVRRNEN
jgi:hypothetical protein